MTGTSELAAFVKVTAYNATSMLYARFVSSSIPTGKLRLLALLPFLPWYFSTVHLRTIFTFLLVWLAPLKLLLLTFGLGPLSPSLPLLPFIAAASLHIKLKTTSHSQPTQTYNEAALKVLALSILLALYRYKHQLPNFVLLSGYCLHLYLSMDIILSSSAFIAANLLCLDVEPQFHAPLTSTSLQDFWGRRWNLMATDILHPAIYQPIQRRFGTYIGIMAAFLVSGLMHEVLFFYLTEEKPRWEASVFFVLQEVCTVLEVKGRKGGWRRWRPSPNVARLVAVGFVTVTSYSLLFRPIVRSGVDEVVVAETEAMFDFFVNALNI